MCQGASESEFSRVRRYPPLKGSRTLRNVFITTRERSSRREHAVGLSRNPFNTSYVDWLIGVVDGEIPKPPTEPVSSLKRIA